MQKFHYKAFISYSHKDRNWGEWLFKALESYSIPRHLIGKNTKSGIVPSHLKPIFRDREELAASDSLSEEIRTALKASEYLILLCSKNAARSPWVNKEIEEFSHHHGPQNILCLIIDGEPNAVDDGFDEAEECFPQSLRNLYQYNASFEPIAADLRKNGDGKKFALLKIIAGMVGVGLDEIVRRDLQRKYRRVTAITLASITGMILMGLLTYEAITARNDAEKRRDDAEGLIEYMLTDLRDKLEPVGRLDVLDSVGEKAVGYYQAQNQDNLSPDSLGRRARAFHLLGEIDHLQDNLASAQQKFEQTASVTASLLKKSPDNTQRIFDHSQSVYWVGYVQWLQGSYQKAEQNWGIYKDLAEKLVAIEPDNADWQLEFAYAHSNMGTLYLQNFGHPGKAVIHFTLALEKFQKLTDQQPSDNGTLRDLADGHAWLSDAAMYAGDLKLAFLHRNKEYEIYKKMVKSSPQNMQAQRDIVSCRSALAELEFISDNISVAEQIIRKAWLDSKNLLNHDLNNGEWRQQATFIGMRKSKILLAAGKISEASDSLLMTQKLAQDIAIDTIKRRVEIHYQGQLLTARISQASGMPEKAKILLKNLRNEMEPFVAKEGNNPLFQEIWDLTRPKE